ncbi:hypothetical protein Ocin01_06478 [Orchesella cincta]|uniref:Uncharacterized protein n=1 Tax=Orchesella cincta TaxID=48709 RepID=A0A1D2N4K8_ORCCI|nr:hypothetical protein Ocin01_06478 [Orchesella cincta]
MDSTVSESIRITFDKPKAKDASNNSASSSNKDGQQLLMTNQTSATEKEIQVDQSCPELEELSSPKKSHHVSSTISKGLSKNAATNSQHTASSLSIGTSNGNNTAGCERLQKESTMPMPPPLKRTTSAPTPTASVPSKALRDKKQIFDPRTEAVKISPKPIHKVTATVTDSLHLQESSSTSSPSTQGTGRQDAAKNKNIPPPTDQRSCNSTVTTKPDSGNSTPQNKEAVPNSPVCNIGFSGGEIRMLPASPVSKSVSNTNQSRNNNTTGNSRNSKDRDNARDSSSSERSRSNSGSRHESRNGQNYSNRGNSSSVRGSHRGGRSGRPTTQYPMSPPITPPDPSAPPLMSISDFDSPANETLRQQTSPPDSNNTKRGRRRNRRGGHYSQQTAPFGPRSPPFNNYEFENSNSGYRYPQQQQQQQHNPNYYPNAGRPYRGGGNQRSNWGGMPRGNARGRYQNFSAPQVQAYSYPWF